MDTSWWPKRRREHALFTAWVVVGALTGFGAIDILASGSFLLVGATLAVIVLLAVVGPQRAVLGSAAGLALATGYLAWINRQGPHWFAYTAVPDDVTRPGSPWGWLAATVLLAALGLLGLRRPDQLRRTSLGPVGEPGH